MVHFEQDFIQLRLLFHKLKHLYYCSQTHFTYTLLIIRTPYYYGQFAFSLSLRKESFTCSPNSTRSHADTPLICSLSMAPSMSVLTGFDCRRIELIYILFYESDFKIESSSSINSLRIPFPVQKMCGDTLCEPRKLLSY